MSLIDAAKEQQCVVCGDMISARRTKCAKCDVYGAAMARYEATLDPDLAGFRGDDQEQMERYDAAFDRLNQASDRLDEVCRRVKEGG